MDDIDVKAVGVRIRKIRKDKLGLSMAKFADLIDGENGNARSGTISNWETGKNLPNNERLKRIAELGDTSVEKLLYGTDKERYDEYFEFLWEKNILNKKRIENGKELYYIKIPGVLSTIVDNELIDKKEEFRNFYRNDYYSLILFTEELAEKSFYESVKRMLTKYQSHIGRYLVSMLNRANIEASEIFDIESVEEVNFLMSAYEEYSTTIYDYYNLGSPSSTSILRSALKHNNKLKEE